MACDSGIAEKVTMLPYPIRDLRKKICECFDSEGLTLLANDLSIDWDELKGSRKSTKVQDLIVQLGHNSRLPALLKLLREERPNVLWDFDPAEINSRIIEPVEREDVGSNNVQLEALFERLNDLQRDISKLPTELLESIKKTDSIVELNTPLDKIIESQQEGNFNEELSSDLRIILYCLHELTQATKTYNENLVSSTKSIDLLLDHQKKRKKIGKGQIVQVVVNITAAMNVYSKDLDRYLPVYARAHSQFTDQLIVNASTNLKIPTLDSLIEISSIQSTSNFYLGKIQKKVETGKFFLTIVISSTDSLDSLRPLMAKKAARAYKEAQLHLQKSIKLDIETFELAEQHLLKAKQVLEAVSEYLQFRLSTQD